jgi:Asp-tRNA(Asn)/Glu-tRNA(Gln) amidotransferase A subunit family amidase
MGFVGALPFGLQLQGRDFDEIMLYRVAAVVEDLVRERWPDEATRTPARREAVADLVQRAAA